MTQYSKRMVIIHWLTLALLIAAWYFGHSLDEARHAASATLAGYVVHAILGGSIMLLVLLRLYARNKDGVPPAMGDTPMDKLAKGIHYAIYGLLLMLPVSGMLTVLTSDVRNALITGDATLLPAKFTGVIAHEVHEILVPVLLVLVVVHVLGALKHQIVLKDGLMERMMLRRK
ncbi:MAG: cytochrome b/b6 domain-containing protein [Gallionellaceae bacterium]|jgi:cytochrome b561